MAVLYQAGGDAINIYGVVPAFAGTTLGAVMHPNHCPLRHEYAM
jgi:hypothetical protein